MVWATATATDFTRNFTQYQRNVAKGPVQVKSHDRVTGYYISPQMFEDMQKILLSSRKRYHPSELPDSALSAIRDAQVDKRHAYLDALMD